MTTTNTKLSLPYPDFLGSQLNMFGHARAALADATSIPCKPSRANRTPCVLRNIFFALFHFIFLGLSCSPVYSETINTPREIQLERLASDSELFSAAIKRIPADQVSALINDLNQGFLTPYDKNSNPELKKSKILLLADEPQLNDEERQQRNKNRRGFIKSLSNTGSDLLLEKVLAVQKEYEAYCKDKNPRIHNIGLQPVLTFEKQTSRMPVSSDTSTQRAVRIEIDGYDLDPACVTFYTQIGGTVPLLRDYPYYKDYHFNKPTSDHPDSGVIALLEPYINRLKTKDQLSVSITLSKRNYINQNSLEDTANTSTSNAKVVSYASRVFTMYEIEDYREQFLKSRLSPSDINPYPLPPDEAEMLFGPLVRQNYFVIRVSLRNEEADTKLVSTGMVRAYGRALVVPNDKAQPTYTIPITVAPHSLQQIYAILADEEVNQSRSQVFRGLEFIGALATAVNALSVNAVRAGKNLGIFTGVFTPELRRAWPDRWPGYQRNLVNFAMPDLMKVPASSVADHKYLFFSKKEIEGLIQDQNIYAISSGDRDIAKHVRQESNQAPDVALISIGFDNLDIRFEKVFDIAKSTVRDELLELTIELPRQIEELKNLKASWMVGKTKFSNLSGADFDNIQKTISASITKQDNRKDSSSPTQNDVNNVVLKPIRSLVEAIEPKAGSVLDNELFSKSEFSLAALEALAAPLHRITQDLARGADSQAIASDVSKIKETLKTTKSALEFYRRVADFLKSNETKDPLVKLNTATDGLDNQAKKTTAEVQLVAAHKALKDKIKNLHALMPINAKVMESVNWGIGDEPQ